MRRLGNLVLHAGDGLGRLLLIHKSRCEETEGPRGVWIDDQRLFEQGHRLGNLLLHQPELRQFQIGSRVFWVQFDGLMKVRVCFIEVFLVLLRHAAPDVGVWKLGIDGDGRVGDLLEAAEIMCLHGNLG